MILHIDMDAFYASVEQVDNPNFLGKCVIVGGLSGRGVVSAASYEARKFCIHSAMPMFKARQMCPHGIFIRPRMRRYKAVSKVIMSLLEEFSPQIEPISIDEAYMDISGCERLHGEPRQIAVQIKQSDFRSVTRSITLSNPIQSSENIYNVAKTLLADYTIRSKIRLIGVGASGLVSATEPVQMDIFEYAKNKHRSWEEVDRVVDNIEQKFGKDIIKRGTLSDQ